MIPDIGGVYHYPAALVLEIERLRGLLIEVQQRLSVWQYEGASALIGLALVPEPPIEANPQESYYILNRNQYWWNIDGHGYTQNLDESWRVPKAKALSICRDRPTEDKAYLATVVDAQSKTIRIVDSWKFGEPLEVSK